MIGKAPKMFEFVLSWIEALCPKASPNQIKKEYDSQEFKDKLNDFHRKIAAILSVNPNTQLYHKSNKNKKKK